LGAVYSGDCLFAFFGIGHLDEAEAARPARIAIGHDAYAIHLPVCGEQLTQIIFRRIEIQVAYKNILHGNSLRVSYLIVLSSAEAG
jgi:hypothetical protein